MESKEEGRTSLFRRNSDGKPSAKKKSRKKTKGQIILGIIGKAFVNAVVISLVLLLLFLGIYVLIPIEVINADARHNLQIALETGDAQATAYYKDRYITKGHILWTGEISQELWATYFGESKPFPSETMPVVNP